MNENNVPQQIRLLEISLSERYQAAWSEINSRIEARQNVQIAFVTVVWAVLGILWSNPTSSATTTIFSSLGTLLPILSLTFSLWTCHHDLTIGLLSAFCRECEDKINGDKNSDIPSWHASKQGWIAQALQYRKWSDYAFIIVIIFTSLPALQKLYSILSAISWKGMLDLIMILTALISAGLVFRNRRIRQEIMNDWSLHKVDGVWKFQRNPSQRV